MENYSGVSDLARIIPGGSGFSVILPYPELLALIERGSGIPRVLSTEKLEVETILPGGISG